METYCETGVHPDIEKAIEEHRERPAEKPLPLFDPDRPFIYFQFSISGEAIGRFSLQPVRQSSGVWYLCDRVTVELFREHHPRGVEMLQNLCKRGSQASLENRCVHKLLTECAFFMGRPKSVLFLRESTLNVLNGQAHERDHTSTSSQSHREGYCLHKWRWQRSGHHITRRCSCIGRDTSRAGTCCFVSFCDVSCCHRWSEEYTWEWMFWTRLIKLSLVPLIFLWTTSASRNVEPRITWAG